MESSTWGISSTESSLYNFYFIPAIKDLLEIARAIDFTK
jgi:hypothetical protein